jgi:hypothetical protein
VTTCVSASAQHPSRTTVSPYTPTSTMLSDRALAVGELHGASKYGIEDGVGLLGKT